jgi:lipid A 3-O-deacylase
VAQTLRTIIVDLSMESSMRRILAALALGGLLGCSGVTTTARAAAPSAASLGDVDSSGSAPTMQIAAGVFALVEAYDYPYNVGASYVARPRGAWRLAPGAGIALGPDGIAFAYLDVRRDFALGHRWYLTPGLAAGFFTNGDEIGTNDALEFQTSIAFTREISRGWRVGLAGTHISNAGLSHPNNGTETLLVTLTIPLVR